jgi:hypothetical protein
MVVAKTELHHCGTNSDAPGARIDSMVSRFLRVAS